MEKEGASSGGMAGDFVAWLNTPFRSDMSAASWFGFVGLLLVIVVVWRSILSHIE